MAMWTIMRHSSAAEKFSGTLERRLRHEGVRASITMFQALREHCLIDLMDTQKGALPSALNATLLHERFTDWILRTMGSTILDTELLSSSTKCDRLLRQTLNDVAKYISLSFPLLLLLVYGWITSSPTWQIRVVCAFHIIKIILPRTVSP